MPKRPTKRETKRPAPYGLKAPASRQTSTSMAAALVSPMTPWTPHHSHHQSLWDPHMAYYPQQHQPMMQDHLPISAPPPQPVQAPSHPGQSAPWTSAEDSALIDAKSQGLGWNEIHQRFFPNKSGNACRKRHERLMVKIRTTEWSEARIHNVMNAYNSPGVREHFWRRIAEPFGERWEDVEKVCFQQGLKGLRTTVNASHSRGRSRASSGPNAASEYDHTSTHEEYDPKYDTSLDDSGIDVTGPGHSRRSSQVVQHNIPMESLLRRPSSAYKYS